jgi:hypothetical protein
MDSIHASTPPKSANRVAGGACWVSEARRAEDEEGLDRFGVEGSRVTLSFRLEVDELPSLGELGVEESAWESVASRG